jgi:multidrug efflux pump subunit AcrA (membrane-fusion protein)
MRSKRVLAAVVAALLMAAICIPAVGGQDAGAGAGAKAQAGGAGTLFGTTAPSEKAEMTLSSRTSDVVFDIMVKRGDVVKPGQVLASGDIREEEAEMRGIALVANSEVAIRAAEVTREHRFNKLKRMDGGGNNFSEFERLEAKLDLDLAELEIDKAKLEQDRAKEQMKALQARIAGKQLVSRIGGIVKEINIEKGGVIDPQKPAMVIVNNTPLWVNVPLPVETSLTLMKLQRANKNVEFGVLYPGAQKPVSARVIYFSPEAEAGIQNVTLELPNDEQLPAGLQVEIIVPNMEKVAEGKVK